MHTSIRPLTRRASVIATALATTLGLGATPVVARATEFVDLPPVTFPDVDPCTEHPIDVTITSQLQVVETGTGSTVIFRSSTTASDGATGRGIETRHFAGDRYDIRLQFMVSHPDGHRYSIRATASGEGVPVFGPPTMRCIVPART